MAYLDYTESILSLHEAKGGMVHPDITLAVFQFIEKDPFLLAEYQALAKKDKDTLNKSIGKNLRAHYGLEIDKKIPVLDKCSLIKSYTRFKPKK